MKASLVARLAHHHRWCELMARGLRRHGIDCAVGDEPVAADFAVCWGWRIGSELRAKGADVLVMEQGYVGDRRVWTSLGWNGLNGRARFPALDDGGARWRKHFGDAMGPWRGHAGYALVCGQVPGDRAVRGVDIAGWCRGAIEILSSRGFATRFRPHPRAPMMGITSSEETLDDDIAAASVVATFNSTSGVRAALAGIPVIAVDRGSMAWPVASHRLDVRPADLHRPDRQLWAHQLAWCQWTAEEIAAGTAWESVRTCR